jgi:hypothetical protein
MSSSIRKLASARANGAKSHGPATPEGLHISALNSFVHGLASKTVVLTNESKTRFEQIFEAYIHQFQPLGDVEMDLVEEMTVAKWQQRRGWSIQTATLDHRRDLQDADLISKFESLDQPTRLAIAFSAEANDSKALALLLRYESTHRRTYNRAFQGLLDLQAIRKLTETQTPPEQELRNEPNPINEQQKLDPTPAFPSPASGP